MAAADDFSEQQVREFKEAFGFFNSAGARGETELDADEILKVISKFMPEEKITKEEVIRIVKEVDTDDTGTVDFPKFLRIMSKSFVNTESLTDQTDTMTDAFNYFVGDGSDSFGQAELTEMMEKMGEKMSGDEIKEMMTFLDPDGTGKVTYEDFEAVMKKV